MDTYCLTLIPTTALRQFSKWGEDLLTHSGPNAKLQLSSLLVRLRL